MELEQTAISDLKVLCPKVFGDARGFSMETFRANDFEALGITGPFVQDNHSGSHRGILRGLHYQIRQPQGKLVRVIVGEVFDVAVDLRRSSPTFGKWQGVRLSAENKKQFWVPAGFAHGFYVLSEWAEFVYKLTDYYAPQWERCISWNDPTVGIVWPLVDGQPPQLSERDKCGKLLADAEVYE